jgi:predicted metal-dependent phosphoesterase TrpH
MILELLKKRGIALEGDAPLDLALKSASVGRPHIAAALVRRGVVGSIEAAFKQYLGEGRSCYVPASSISVEETLTTIHEAGGLAVLAHPHLIQDEWALQELLAMPLDGIEAYYAKFAADRSQRWLEVAARKNWLITGGSDFHGDAKPQIPLGASWVDEAAFQELWQRYSRTS